MVASTVFLDIEQEHLGQRYDLMTIIDAIPWNKDGLITAIAQDIRSKDVLMLAWINREALLETLNTEQVCYWSRSRQCLWRKGESSGHHQKLIEARLDCDGDSILFLVEQTGAACHTFRPNCFYLGLDTQHATILTQPII
ncbi:MULTISPECIES: phosphoribosyl-AMP cyclohydrolase [Acinetobacter calcoaceticus/baumannii complex]|uniref:phosphoribosyl-AMP cyclohydrolase n=1 Tax=Acinetobacter TaxID=469 RepID=UPI00034A7029|nr:MULTISPECIES: phosphoribosyl-AMP cyclohydrolase [Acinetobacter calcoaceticus/baumannii complex]MCR0008593.1 phosphoribosyl-AMP cyclohydrolase [Acinetobacter baumannii]MCV2392562.1 phosphoribosyl-AMP cyclohydrolase [Acinetobacter baumannii]MDC4749086.1 phosphoribosyl-AMP cyclohydrolase [Acinetobacter baumannii]MDC4998574.1 phosphoribosyl-AMP cyclohydrolase [Acinetobacter baumannii]MDC5148663.1 phosphoribosyl-AMP cyclohydrolase [Acinetobacter baumannii]